jgi:hypothetical protein
MHSEMGIKSLSLCDFFRFAVNDGRKHPSITRPLTSLYAPLALSLQLSEKGNALFSFTEW